MTKQYKCLNKQSHKIGAYELCPLRYQDIFKIKEWRNEQIDVLRQTEKLSDQDQEYYYQNVIRPLFEKDCPRQILFSYLKDGKLVGYGGLVHINWIDKRAEVSFLVNTTFTVNPILYGDLFANYLELIKKVAFETIHFNRLFTETFDIRAHHISILEQVGFVLEGRMKEHICIQDEFIDSLLHGYLKRYYDSESKAEI